MMKSISVLYRLFCSQTEDCLTKFVIINKVQFSVLMVTMTLYKLQRRSCDMLSYLRGIVENLPYVCHYLG